MSGFTKAVRRKAKLRAALIGPAGSGKTFTALKLASYLGSRVAVIDTEYGSASKYAPADGQEADPERGTFAFDVLALEEFHPRQYVAAIQEAEKAGYDVVVVDSLSHAWVGKGGALDLHDTAVDRQRTKNSFTAWAEVTPHHRALVEALVQSRCHVIATVRAKTDYVQEKDERTGKPSVRKVGMAPVQRDGLEYEFDLVGDMDVENSLVVTKSRCAALSGQVFKKPGKELATALAEWLGQGADAPVVTPPAPPPPARQAPAPSADPEQDEPPRKVTSEELSELHALVDESGYPWSKWLRWLKDKHGFAVTQSTSMADVTADAYERLLPALRAAALQRNPN